MVEEVTAEVVAEPVMPVVLPTTYVFRHMSADCCLVDPVLSFERVDLMIEDKRK